MPVSRRAKIVSTIGPACSSREKIHALVEAGVDVARLNMSHGEQAQHEEVHGYIREASE
ncbi:pyruvate kinase, partial [Actinomadura sp. HBU206391]|uniref:pyruvate kinase n=1 Tax=Actinomadura sp. HBU206391 TaxID=2731692 RepID=UPI001D6E2D1D